MNPSDQQHAALMEAFDVFLVLLPDATVRIGDGYRVVTVPSFPIPLVNAVISEGTNEEATIRDLAAAIAEVEAAGMPPVVTGRDGVDAHVLEEARRLGLMGEERIPGMSVSRDAFRPSEAPNVELRRVGADPELLDVAMDVTARGFGAPRALFEPLFASGMQAEGLDLWLAFVSDVAVSTATGLVRGDHVGIFDVATPPEHRRKGYGANVTSAAVAAGFGAGATTAYLQSSEMGFPVYEALGFRTVATYVVQTWPSAENP
ncbi:MAG: GNAT family N-acetyltransferase [Actinomycetota bacterium]